MTQSGPQTVDEEFLLHVEHLLVDLLGARVAGEERGEAGQRLRLPGRWGEGCFMNKVDNGLIFIGWFSKSQSRASAARSTQNRSGKLLPRKS